MKVVTSLDTRVQIVSCLGADRDLCWQSEWEQLRLKVEKLVFHILTVRQDTFSK